MAQSGVVGPQLARSGETEAVVLVKALPQVGDAHGETVCVAALDAYGRWLRLYPITFRQLTDAQRFARWDRIKFRWGMPKKDIRGESRRVDQDTIEIVGELKRGARSSFLAHAVVASTRREYEAGRSLALVEPASPSFYWRRRPQAEIDKVARAYEQLAASPDLFGGRHFVPREVAPYDFFFRYKDDDGEHDARCHDWEIEATFLRRRSEMGEAAALGWMEEKFGAEYPSKGMLLAMGTHSQRPWQWMIIGVIRIDHIRQTSLVF